jgi:NADH-quinone oxidoreductase subunit C
MTNIDMLCSKIKDRFADKVQNAQVALNELTIDILPDHFLGICQVLRDDPEFDFKMLMDVCGVDYLHYGLSEWETTSATATGFERGVDRRAINNPPAIHPRFGAIYHLLSLNLNHRLRIRVPLDKDNLKVPSLIHLWPSANWFEREAFDLFGIIFIDHPDLRRILTDYGFVGHPFRKDFPLSGNVEVRYDAKLRKVIYEPVSIQPRILEPKVIRRDNRYESGE